MRPWKWAAGAICLGVIVSAVLAAGEEPAQRKLRIGIYDPRAIAVASRNSGAIQAKLQSLQKEMKEAQVAKDQKKIAQMKERGSAMQTVLHLQAFSGVRVDDILSQITDEMPKIAKRMNVDAIVAQADYQSENVETVDVTDEMMKAFAPDEKTLQTVAQVRKSRPMDMAVVLQHKD